MQWRSNVVRYHEWNWSALDGLTRVEASVGNGGLRMLCGFRVGWPEIWPLSVNIKEILSSPSFCGISRIHRCKAHITRLVYFWKVWVIL